jgi:uncharacterized glyoxalase superfamily protein PhnB
MLEWYARVFGFVEKGRHPDKEGTIRNAEMTLGDNEFWLDGSGPGWWEKKGHPPEQWIGVWVDDPDAMYERVRAAGVEADPPSEPPWGPYRILTVKDPEGYSWGFMSRTN